MHESGSGTKRNYLGAHGISGAEGRPAVPSAWRQQPPLTHSCPSWRPTGTPQEGGKGSFALVPVNGGRAPIPTVRRGGAGDKLDTFSGPSTGRVHPQRHTRREWTITLAAPTIRVTPERPHRAALRKDDIPRRRGNPAQFRVATHALLHCGIRQAALCYRTR
jgi:hypothetical protein